MRWWSVIGCLALAAAGCSKTESTGPTGPIQTQLQLNWVPEPEFGGFYAAQLTGAWARHGLDVQIQPGGPGTPVVQMVAAGQVPFGIASADEVIIARARGADVVAIFAVYQTCPQGIMIHASRKLTGLAELFQRGGTVAMEPGLAYVKFLKNKYGFNHVQVVPYSDSLAPFLNDVNLAQQCFVTSESIAARREKSDPQTFLVAEAGYNPYTTVIITRGDILKGQPRLAHSLVAAATEGWQAYLADAAPANQVMEKLNPTMDGQTFAEAAEVQKGLIEPDAVPLGGMNRQRWEELGRQLVELKVIDKAPSAAECFAEP